MGILLRYIDLEEKKESFQIFNGYWTINTVAEFDRWYNGIKKEIEHERRIDNVNYERTKIRSFINPDHIFRGMREATYKLFTSSQRLWIANEIKQIIEPRTYLQFVAQFISEAREKPIFKRVFDYYGLTPNQREFPLLTILQHYGAPTPLMDWSYDIDVALYFATENVRPSESKSPIEQYFSVYHINKSKRIYDHSVPLNNILEQNGGSFPLIRSFDKGQQANQITTILYFLTDFEKSKPKTFEDERPLTLLYNQNIIPQKGLFLFNPHEDKPLENYFYSGDSQNEMIQRISPLQCVNIKKDLAEYVRRKIKLKDVDSKFIYPSLNNYCKMLTEELMDRIVKEH